MTIFIEPPPVGPKTHLVAINALPFFILYPAYPDAMVVILPLVPAQEAKEPQHGQVLFKGVKFFRSMISLT
jgi:hypothetical protein